MDFVFNMLYWDSQDHQRRENARIAWQQLQTFAAYCTRQGLQVTARFYDFSEQAIAVDDKVIHIPFPVGEFCKTRKINLLLQDTARFSPRFVGIFDADIVIRETDYEFLVDWMKHFSPDHFYVCEVDDLLDNQAIDYARNQISYSDLKFHSRARGMIGDLGGLYFVPFQALMDFQPFDERFVVWGGEDNAASAILQLQGLTPLNLCVRPLHLFHQSLESSAVNSGQYQYQLQLLSELMGKFIPDGLNFALSLGELGQVVSAPGKNMEEQAFVDHFIDRNFLDVLLPERDKILRFIHRNLLCDAMLGDALEKQCPIEIPVLMRLIALSELNRKVCRALTQQLVPGQEFDGGQLYQLIAQRYGGKQEAAQQAFVFLYWLQLLGILRCCNTQTQRYRWMKKLQVPQPLVSEFLKRVHKLEGGPPALPLSYLQQAPLWKFFDLENLPDISQEETNSFCCTVKKNGMEYLRFNLA